MCKYILVFRNIGKTYDHILAVKNVVLICNNILLVLNVGKTYNYILIV